MRPDRVSNLGPLALESDALLTVLCGPADTVFVYSRTYYFDCIYDIMLY